MEPTITGDGLNIQERPVLRVQSPVSRVHMTVVQRVYTKSRVQRRESSVECLEARVQSPISRDVIGIHPQLNQEILQ